MKTEGSSFLTADFVSFHSLTREEKRIHVRETSSVPCYENAVSNSSRIFAGVWPVMREFHEVSARVPLHLLITIIFYNRAYKLTVRLKIADFKWL